MRVQKTKWYRALAKLRRNNIMFCILCAGVVFFFGGIIHALFADLFNACAIAIKNTSHGLILKVCDVLFVKAAKTDLTELMYMPSIVIQLIVTTSPFFVLDMIRHAIRDLNEGLKRSKDIDSRIDSLKNPDAPKRTVEDELKTLAKANRSTSLDIKDLLRFMRKALCVGKVVAVICFFLFFTDLVSNVLARSYYRGFQWRVATVRPYISEFEYHVLNQKWALMQGRDDYKKIMRLLDEYAKRDGSDGVGAKSSLTK